MNTLTQQRYSIKKLDPSHQRQHFSCGIESLDIYLHKQAGQDKRKNIAITYILNDNEANKIIGYYTLSAFTIELNELPEKTIKKLPRYPLLPATLIGRLAVDNNYQKSGFGEILLIDALKRTYEQSKEVGSHAVIVDAINAKAISFYQQYGFTQFSNQKKNKLYLSMEVARKI